MLDRGCVVVVATNIKLIACYRLKDGSLSETARRLQPLMYVWEGGVWMYGVCCVGSI